jgi:plastocyanin
MRSAVIRLAAACALAPGDGRLAGQSVVDRTPSLQGAWLTAPRVVQFNFVHRFQESGAPEHRISNSPTFVATIAVPRLRAALGAAWATNSDVVPRMPNEWELFVRGVPLARDNPLADLSLQVGYNQAARSLDLELGATRRLGAVRLLAVGRAFSNAFDAGQPRYAAGGGVVLRLRPNLAVAGDLAALHQREADERPVWSAGLQVGIAGTPHSISLHATNAATGTLEGTSRGSQVRIGFEYTVPIPLGRYHRPAARPPLAAAGHARPDTVSVRIQDFAFAPARIEIAAGTTVTWINDGAVPHTVTADDGTAFASEIVAAEGGTFTFRFLRPGTYAFHCAPHPYMRGVVVVR